MKETVADADGALMVTLTAHQPGITRVAPTVPEFNLERTPRLTVPPFTHAAQPNLTKCYAGLKALIEKEPRLGFNDPSGAGLAWMKAVNQVLFDTSVFHGQFAARGFSVPLAFTYAKDLKLLKKQAAPRMERAFIDHSAKEIARLLMFSHMMAEPWTSSEFKVALVALHDRPTFRACARRSDAPETGSTADPARSRTAARSSRSLSRRALAHSRGARGVERGVRHRRAAWRTTIPARRGPSAR